MIIIQETDRLAAATETLVALLRNPVPFTGWSPNRLFFGFTMKKGQSKIAHIELSNTGTAHLAVSQIESNVEGITTDKSSLGIRSGEVAEVEVTFTPTQEGRHFGHVFVHTNDPNQKVIEIPIQAVTVEPGPPPSIIGTGPEGH